MHCHLLGVCGPLDASGHYPVFCLSYVILAKSLTDSAPVVMSQDRLTMLTVHTLSHLIFLTTLQDTVSAPTLQMRTEAAETGGY